MQGDAYFPELSRAGTMPAQMVWSADDDGTESIRLMYLLSIAAARRSVLLANSYFVPDDLSVRTLVAARRRGVDVQIIVPGPGDRQRAHPGGLPKEMGAAAGSRHLHL